MSCEIIQFSSAARVPPKRRKTMVRAAGTSLMSRVELEQEPERPACDEGKLSATCKNSRLRQARNKAWNRARWTTRYWRARRGWRGEVGCGPKRGLGGRGFFSPGAGQD